MFTKSAIAASMLLGLGLVISANLEAGGSYQKQNWGIAPPTHFYGGASLGLANQGEFEEGTTAAGKLYGGVKLNRLFGAEFGYMKLGEVESTSLDGRLSTHLKSDTSALYAAGLGYLPVAPNLELMGKLGAISWSQDSSKEIPLIEERSSQSETGISPLLGVGAQYRVGQNMHLRGEWERAFSAGASDTEFETDVDLFTLGVTFSTL